MLVIPKSIVICPPLLSSSSFTHCILRVMLLFYSNSLQHSLLLTQIFVSVMRFNILNLCNPTKRYLLFYILFNVENKIQKLIQLLLIARKLLTGCCDAKCGRYQTKKVWQMILFQFYSSCKNPVRTNQLQSQRGQRSLQK